MSRQSNRELNDPLGAKAIIDYQIWEDAKSTGLVPPPPHIENIGTRWQESTITELPLAAQIVSKKRH